MTTERSDLGKPIWGVGVTTLIVHVPSTATPGPNGLSTQVLGLLEQTVGPRILVLWPCSAAEMSCRVSVMTHVAHAAGAHSGLSSRRDSGFVRWFDSLSLADDGLVGGKAANLGELIRAGLPVPSGFALTAEAFLTALEEGGVRAQLRIMFDDADPSSADALAERAGRARGLVASVKVPEAVVTELRAAYEHLRANGVVAVAVRSSAAGEDSATASFAAMNETFTNVLSEAELLMRWWRVGVRCMASESSTIGSRAVWPASPQSPLWCRKWLRRNARACCSRPTRRVKGHTPS